MTTTAPARAFPTSNRGEFRDDILTNFRVGLRRLTNPDTGQAFTEREIQVATSDLTRWYAEADAVDLVMWDNQRRSIFLADQARIRRATSSFLFSFHGELWGESPRGASGGSGTATCTSTSTETYSGSTTIPDPAAAQCVDPAGLTYQVLFDVTSSGGSATLSLVAVDTGLATNIPTGTKLKWSANKPLTAAEEFTADVDFRGGENAETAEAFAARLLERIRRKPAAGNPAHFRAWALQSSTSVADAFVYPCALWAGTVLVCVTQQRGDTQGPAGRIPGAGALASAIAYLTPPTSPVVPTPPLVIVVAPQANDVDGTILLDMNTNDPNGWADVAPWPEQGSAVRPYSRVTDVTNQTTLRITRGDGVSDPPATTPRLMLWDSDRSTLEEMPIATLALNAGDEYNVTLSQEMTATVAVGQYVMPYSQLAEQIGQAIEGYFDSLGPGEVVDLDADDRAHRAFRHPRTTERSPSRAGFGVLVYLEDVLGSSIIGDAELLEISSNAPPLPGDPVDGPYLNVPRYWGLYPPS